MTMTTPDPVRLTAPAQTSRTLLRLLAAALVVALLVTAVGGWFGYSSYQRVLDRLDKSEQERREDRKIARQQAATIALFASLFSPDPAVRAEARRQLGELGATPTTPSAATTTTSTTQPTTRTRTTTPPPAGPPPSSSPTASPPTAPTTTTTVAPTTTTSRPPLLCRIVPCDRRL